MAAAIAIRPQPGPQERFLASPADIAIYGGAAGGGKTWALLLEPMRHIHRPDFGAVFFRRNTTQVRNEGGLWDESTKLYPAAGGAPKEHTLSWAFPSGASISFAHLEHDKTRFNWQGSQIPLICFDELCHFSEKQFWYMLSRSRSMCGVRPYIRATCNPDADSWLARFIAWWIDADTGLPIKGRAGVLRWFVRIGDTIVWADRPEDLAHHTMPDGDGRLTPIPPKSVTFIPASLRDNGALMAADPGYMANLMALSHVERERLLGGNWKIRPAAGLYFRREWVTLVDAAPAGMRIVRGWDLAETTKTEGNDPDWTCGTKIGVTGDGRYFILDHKSDRLSPNGVERLVRGTAEHDGREVLIDLPQDPGQAGKAQISTYARLLAGFNFRSAPVTGDKVTRFSGFSAQAEAGNVHVLRGGWNDRWLGELENFPPSDSGHDDDADSTSQAFNALPADPATGSRSTFEGVPVTIICVRDGTMAVDSGVLRGDAVSVGTVQKWAAVPAGAGGGFIAGAGDLGRVQDGLVRFQRGTPPADNRDDEDVFVHMRADGTVRTWERGAWLTYDAPFIAEGAGWQIAMGAMAAGATAEEAAHIACQYSGNCAEPVMVLEVGNG